MVFPTEKLKIVLDPQITTKAAMDKTYPKSKTYSVIAVMTAIEKYRYVVLFEPILSDSLFPTVGRMISTNDMAVKQKPKYTAPFSMPSK